MIKRTSLIVLWLLLLVGCAKPLPQDKLDYVGEWRSKEMVLLILADGTVSYERLKNGGKVSINGPLQEFNGNDFAVGFGLLTTTFVVSEPPYQANGHWYMVVDGVRLQKQDEWQSL